MAETGYQTWDIPGVGLYEFPESWTPEQIQTQVKEKVWPAY